MSSALNLAKTGKMFTNINFFLNVKPANFTRRFLLTWTLVFSHAKT